MPESPVSPLDHGKLLRQVQSMNDAQPMSWGIDWYTPSPDESDPRKSGTASLLDSMSMAKQEHLRQLAEEERHEKRVHQRLQATNMLAVDSRISHPQSWQSTLHVDPQLKKQLDRLPDAESSAPPVRGPLRVGGRAGAGSGPQDVLHAAPWRPGSEVGGSFGSYSNPTPAHGLTDGTRERFIAHLENTIGKIKSEKQQLDCIESLPQEVADFKDRLVADIYNLRKQQSRLTLRGELDPRTSAALGREMVGM
uniref:Uncharacterized protein n=1 Tax=Rhizochromulina marina TaxID=1034831 RepID=A0A7S2W8F5_9STRA|mmetsp:Transcript_17405/g.50831  ORF Transcript_17405/g.50831 Transcript_17405/m.50831 type:complete len:251 (+) Transcript_17405:130-882(+)